jgi:SAM-dependent methyltransferase
VDQQGWEERYQTAGAGDIPAPAELLSANAHMLRGGHALDIAMGLGQNAVLLARHGYRVTGIDRSASAVALAAAHARRQGVTINAVQADIVHYPLEPESCDLIADFYFLERTLFPHIIRALRPGGMLFFETYTVEHTRFRPQCNPDYLLQPNELLTAFLDLLVVFYHERAEQDRAIASLIAIKT